MSKATITLNNGQQATANYDLAKIFIYNNRYSNADITNSNYDPTEVIPAGTLMGRITGTQKVYPLTSGASDGSQLPVGVLAADIIISEGSTVSVPICVSGDVAKDQIVLQGSDTLNTIVSGQSLYDRVQQIGIKLVDNTEMTAFDN